MPKPYIQNLTLATCLAILLTGCTRSAYWIDRGRDAADVFTATVGTGGGAKIRVGPVQAAVFENADLVGLRSGHFFADGNGMVDNAELYVLPFPFAETGFGSEIFVPGFYTVPVLRRKHVVARSRLPLIVTGSNTPFYSQLEVAGGLAFTIRFGLNAGELVDFLVGWTGVDLYRDDIAGLDIPVGVRPGSGKERP